MRWRLCALGLLTTAVACGDGTLGSNGKGGTSGAGAAGQSGAGGLPAVSEADAARVRAESHCRLLFECCDPAGDHGAVVLPIYQFDTEAACVAHFQAYYQGVHDEARAAGLTYDPECLGWELAGERANGCSQNYYISWCVDSDIYRGDVTEGRACINNVAGSFDTCQKGLACAVGDGPGGGICVRAFGPNGPRPEPQPVYVEIGQHCDTSALCKGDAFCTLDTQTCVRRSSAGEPCVPELCAAGLYCEHQGYTCAPLSSEGEPCEILSCGAGTYCPSWEQDVSLRVCTRSQADGEPCTIDTSCASGFCREVCAPRPPNVCLSWVPALP